MLQVTRINRKGVGNNNFGVFSPVILQEQELVNVQDKLFRKTRLTNLETNLQDTISM